MDWEFRAEDALRGMELLVEEGKADRPFAPRGGKEWMTFSGKLAARFFNQVAARSQTKEERQRYRTLAHIFRRCAWSVTRKEPLPLFTDSMPRAQLSELGAAYQKQHDALTQHLLGKAGDFIAEDPARWQGYQKNYPGVAESVSKGLVSSLFEHLDF